MTKGSKRMRKKENRKNAECDKKEGEVSKETSRIKKGSNYISYLKKEELQEIRIIIDTEVLDDSDLLQGAVAIGNFSVVKRLLKHGCQINCCGKDGWTCLMWAVKCKRLEMIDLLIKRSADIAAVNAEGDNAMLLAIQSDLWHQDAFLDLLNTISRFSSGFKEVINHANKKGYTLLHLSVKRQWETIVDRLIEDGANVDCINQRGITPLMIAGYSGDASLIRRLLRSKANVLLEDKRGCTAVCYAIAFMLPKHAEVSYKLNDKLAEEFSILTPMMVSEELYLKRRLDLLVFPPSEDFSSTIRKVIVPLMTFLVRFNKDGLLLLFQLQIFGRIHEAIEKHIEDVDYLKALMSVILELVRDCQCCTNEFLPAQVATSFVGTGLPEACLRILKRHDQTTMKESIIKATLLPLISVCTSRGLSGKIWLQNNFKNLSPIYQKCNLFKDKSFKILADDIHKNLLKQSVRDFSKLLRSLESGKLIVQNIESFHKLGVNLPKNELDGNCSTISNSRPDSPSSTDFLCDNYSLENKVENINEQSIFKKIEELKQHNNIKGSKTTEGYTNLTELFMSRKNSDCKKSQLLQKPGIKSCMEECIQAEETEFKNIEKIDKKVKNNTNPYQRPTNDFWIENGKTFSSVLQQSIKIEANSNFSKADSNQNKSSELFINNFAVEFDTHLEEKCSEGAKPLAEILEPFPNTLEFDEKTKLHSFLEKNSVKENERKYKNPISNYLWSLDADDSNPKAEKSNFGKILETNPTIFEDEYNFTYCTAYGEADHEPDIKTKTEIRNKAEFECETKHPIYYNEKNLIIPQEISRLTQEFPSFEDNVEANCSHNDIRLEELNNGAKNSQMYGNNDEKNFTNQISEHAFESMNQQIFEDSYHIDYIDDNMIRNYYMNYDGRDYKINYVSENKDLYGVDNHKIFNQQSERDEAEKINFDGRNNTLDSKLNAAETQLDGSSTKQLEEGSCFHFNENSKPDILVEHEFSTLSNKKKKRENSLNEFDSQMEKLDKQIKHIMNQYETLCRKDFENGYPKAQGDEARLLELMVSLPLVELSHLQKFKQKWNDLKEKLTTKIKKNLSGTVEKVEKYLENFSRTLDKKIEECRIFNEPQLLGIGEDLKYLYTIFNSDEEFERFEEDRFLNNIIQIDDKEFEKHNNFESDYWYTHTAYNENDLNFITNYEINHGGISNNDYSQFKQTESYIQSKQLYKLEDIYGKGDFNRISKSGYISEFNEKFENKFLRPDNEEIFIEDRKSMYCSQNHLDSIIDFMNLNEREKEVLCNGKLILAASSTYPEYKLKDGGNFGTVELGTDQEGYPLAVKRIIRCKTKTMEMLTSTLKSLLNEMSNLHHPNIVPYVNYLETEFNALIAMPLCEKNLDEFIKELKECNDLANRSLDVVHQIMKGLQYLHSRTPPIIHGNLKPTNILIDSKQTVRLADFGLHKVLFKQKSPLVDEMIWWAQETYLTYKSTLKMICTLQSDIQVAGILMHYILTGGVHPFGRSNSILMEDPSVLAPTLHTTNCEANDLLTWMLEDVNNRPNIDQALSHIFFWSDDRKWEFTLACSGVGSNYVKSQLPFDEFSKFINEQTLKEKSEGNWGTIIEQNFPDHYMAASTSCDPDTVSGLLMFINLSILNQDAEFRSRFRRVISFAYPNLPLGLFRFIENSEWETHSELIKYSYHCLYLQRK